MTWGSVGFAQKWPIETSLRGKPFTSYLEYFRACTLILLLLTQFFFYFYQGLFLHKYLYFYLSEDCVYFLLSCIYLQHLQDFCLLFLHKDTSTCGREEVIRLPVMWPSPPLSLSLYYSIYLSKSGIPPLWLFPWFLSLLAFKVLCVCVCVLVSFLSPHWGFLCCKTVAVLTSPVQRALLDQLWPQRARSLS